MPEPDQATRVIRFGVFEVDLHTAELRKQGVRIRLPLQSFQVLEALLLQPGELVTRKELKEKLWPADSFGDFEHGLNAAVNRVREALGDSSDNPRFVETLPRRGYRFVASVNGTPQSTAAGVLEDGEAVKRVASPTSECLDSIAFLPFENAGGEPEMVVGDGAVNPDEPSVSTSPKTSAHPGKRPRRVAGVVAGTVLFAGLGIATIAWLRQTRKLNLPEPRLITTFGFGPTLSRDGKLLAYCSDVGKVVHILLQQTAGGEAIPVITGSSVICDPDLSPDGTRIAFDQVDGIYLTSAFRGEPRLLVGKKHAGYPGFPRFSPAGDSLLYWQEEKAFTVSCDGDHRVALRLNQDFRLYGPALWAPNGKEVLFYGVRSSEQNKPAGWWIVPLSSGKARQPNLPDIERNLFPPISVRSWFRAADGREWIVYSTTDRASWKIWRAPVSAQGTTNERPELVASGSGELGDVGSVSEDGMLSYNIWNITMSIHQIFTGERGQKMGPTVQLPLTEGGTYTSPSVSWDGKKMVYIIANPNQPNVVMLRNLSTGTDHLVDDKGRRRGAVDYTAAITPDGSTVIFERDCKQGVFPEDHVSPLPCSFTVSGAGGESEQICERCTPRGFSSDGAVLLFNKFDLADGNKDRIVAMNLRERTEQDFLSDPKQSVYNANFSRDDRWVAFRRASIGGFTPSQILIARVQHGVAADAANWVKVTDTTYSDDQPQFSADGNTLYFTSDRDGYLCIWVQRLDPHTKHPIGAAVAYEHFHNSAGHDGIRAQRSLYLSVARDKILINLLQGRSELWITKME